MLLSNVLSAEASTQWPRNYEPKYPLISDLLSKREPNDKPLPLNTKNAI